MSSLISMCMKEEEIGEKEGEDRVFAGVGLYRAWDRARVTQAYIIQSLRRLTILELHSHHSI